MALKSGFVALAPGADPKKHRASIKTPKLEITMVVVDSANFDRVIEVCKELVQKEGVKSLNLCPGFSHEKVARVANAVGPGIAIHVARGDIPSSVKADELLKKEGF